MGDTPSLKILVADDDAVIRQVLERNLTSWGYEVVLVEDGKEAERLLIEDDDLRMAILDWQMPGIDGFELCYKIRNEMNIIPFFVILLTARAGRGNTIEGFACGADEYVVKPFDKDVLRARVEAGARSVEQQSYLVKCIRTLERNAARLELLLAKLPVCPHCRRVRGDNDQWVSVMALDSEDFTPAPAGPVCPECSKNIPPAAPDS